MKGSWGKSHGARGGSHESWVMEGESWVMGHGSWVSFVFACWIASVFVGCGPNLQNSSLIQVDLGKNDQERLLRYYLGSYSDGDPFEAGILKAGEGGYLLDLQKLVLSLPAAGDKLRDADGNNLIDWEELQPFLESTYYDVRALPASLADLQKETGYTDSTSWMRVDVDGVMTAATRQIYVAKAAVQAALKSYDDNGRKLIYPSGTTFVAEHWDEDRRIETTAMRKRKDGFWDYFVYDLQGDLAPATSTEPRVLTVPTRCVGCHFGNKKFEPEASFPDPSTPGPHGPRGIHVDRDAADRDVVELFDEHVKRSDTILGPYVTLYLIDLRKRTPQENEIGFLEMVRG